MTALKSLPSERSIDALRQPSCPDCLLEMRLEHVTSGSRAFDVRTFECRQCPRVLKTVVKFRDPMTSVVMQGWLQSGLRAPKSPEDSRAEEP